MLRLGMLKRLNATGRDREYYLLGGNLYKYKSLYDEFPASDSWIWRYYPDGIMWKALVERGNVTAAVLATNATTAELERDGTHDEAWLRQLSEYFHAPDGASSKG